MSSLLPQRLRGLLGSSDLATYDILGEAELLIGSRDAGWVDVLRLGDGAELGRGRVMVQLLPPRDGEFLWRGEIAPLRVGDPEALTRGLYHIRFERNGETRTVVIDEYEPGEVTGVARIRCVEGELPLTLRDLGGE